MRIHYLGQKWTRTEQNNQIEEDSDPGEEGEAPEPEPGVVPRDPESESEKERRRSLQFEEFIVAMRTLVQLLRMRHTSSSAPGWGMDVAG